jgi:hypothetical protein
MQLAIEFHKTLLGREKFATKAQSHRDTIFIYERLCAFAATIFNFERLGNPKNFYIEPC